jgi:hypothetical protein
MAEQEEDMKCKRILLTAREKKGIVNYCFVRRELLHSHNQTFLVDVFITRFYVLFETF